MEHEEFESIYFTMEDTEEEIEFIILDHVTWNKENYILVIEADKLDDEEADAMILKEKESDTEDVVYEIIEDENEMYQVAEKFRELAEEYDLDVE
ncbi:MAG: DUF1292 domain-containing protein [Epulopiscium sp.]|nr:DUF1292 domain-containing protein [Candidatus Epulonipiscium sp.]